MGNSLPGIKAKLGLPGGVDIAAANAREGALMTARDATAHRVAQAGNLNPLGLAALAVSHPLTFLTVLADRSPAAKSLIAVGAYRAAESMLKVPANTIRAAVTAVATSNDDQEQQ